MTTPTTSTAPGPARGHGPARTRRALTLAVLAAAATGALTACGTGYPLAPVAHSSAAPAAPAADAASAAGTAAGAAAPAAAADGQTNGGGGGGSTSGASNGGASNGGSNGGGSATGGQSGGSRSTPAIASFRVVSQPVCAVHGTPDAPFSTPGKGVTIAWSVTGVDGAALAVDNPTTYGAYGTSYPAKGQQEFPFACTPGTTTSHTFTVWPAGAEGTSRTLTVSAHSDG